MRTCFTLAASIAIVASSLLSLASAQNPSTQPTTSPATQPAPPFELIEIDRPGPVRGVAAKIDLSDPRVKIVVRRAIDQDPDGTGPNVTRLDTLRNIAQRYDLELAINASFFAAPEFRLAGERKIRYFVGNPAHPVGWLIVNKEVLTKPARPMASLIVHDDGRVELVPDIVEVSPTVRDAVSGNVMILRDGQDVVEGEDKARHPRSSAGLSADGKTLILAVIDGRRPGHSQGVTLRELATIMTDLGAATAINLDGGGSATLVAENPTTGVFTVLNRPSDGSDFRIPITVERAVTDAIGVEIRE